MSDRPIIVVLDYPSSDAALALVEQLDPKRCNVKVGKELFTRAGPDVVRALVDRGFRVFLDLKYHDIPNTVGAACAAATDLGVWMLNVHASGGPAMLQAARAAVGDAADRPKIIAVTVLTSLDSNDLSAAGFAGDTATTASKLANLTEECGLDGVVCSPQEIAMMRAERSDNFLLVTPGIRPAGSAVGDQKRVMTPADALAAGASYLVIGRPITAAPDPMEAFAAIEASLA
ncbi:MAG: orotidine-5'-phosphate decarboxylase [Gammaproteobacteria bacterium]|nr:orotidine-5'-phosphate decarboxylase [Gammaproteobacteria bacterium]